MSGSVAIFGLKALTWLSPTERALLSNWVTVDTCLCLCIYLYVSSAGANIKTSTKITTRLQVVYNINQGILYIQNVGWCHGTHVNVVSLMLIRKVQSSLCICLLNFCMLNSVCAHLLCRSSAYWIVNVKSTPTDLALVSFLWTCTVLNFIKYRNFCNLNLLSSIM